MKELVAPEWGRNAFDSDPMDVQKQMMSLEAAVLRSAQAHKEAMNEIEWQKTAAEIHAARSHMMLQQSLNYNQYVVDCRDLYTQARRSAMDHDNQARF